MGSAPFSLSPNLRISIEPPHSSVLSHIHIDGRASYVASLENLSTIPAQFPFLCFMDLGLNLEAHRNWYFDKISSDGRRLVRCSYRGLETLLPGNRIAALSLVMRYTATNGEHVAFGSGAPVPLESLKDLRLFTVAGAANFPAVRETLTIPADDIRSQIPKWQPSRRMAG